MAEKNKMAVNVYQIDRLPFGDDEFADIADFIVKTINRGGGGYTQEKLSASPPDNYDIRVYSSFSIYAPRWRKFIGPALHKNSRLGECENLTYSFFALIGFGQQMYVITGGGASFAIERFTTSNFGLEILVRLFEKNSKVIRSIQERGLTGIVLGQSRFYKGEQRISDENQFGKIFRQVNAELSKAILVKFFGFSEISLVRKTSGCQAKSSFQINKAIEFNELLPLVKKFSEILELPAKFALNKVTLISKRNKSNHALLIELSEHLIQTLHENVKDGNSPDVDFCHPEFEKYLTASCFRIIIDSNEKIEVDELKSLQELIQLLKDSDNFHNDDEYHFKLSVLHRVIETVDENDIILTHGTVVEHLHGEIAYKDKTYFFVDSEWYEIHPAFIRDLNTECALMLKDVSDNEFISKKFDYKKRESEFNQQFIGEDGFLVFDTVTPQEIEACDILHYDNNNIHVIHVKKGFDNSVRELASQVMLSAKRIESDISSGYNYLEELEWETRKKKDSESLFAQKIGNQDLPNGILKEIFKERKKIDIIFCLAFVDTAVNPRMLKNEIEKFQSNIAKYSLFELRREIRSMGFGFKVIQLQKA